LSRARTAVVFRHSPLAHLGSLQAPLVERGYEIRNVDVATEVIDPRLAAEADVLIVLGGSVGAYQEDLFPFLTAELTAIRARLEAGAPVLGVCLGAQLMAASLGAAVYPGPVTEIGFFSVDAGDDPVLEVFDKPVLQWHGDTFDLPEGAVAVASGDNYRNQAFRYGEHGLAVQFHPEVDGGMLRQWIVDWVDDLAQHGIDPRVFRAEGARHADPQARRGQRMLERWLESVEQLPR
jgi:GMP synthase (glutamine-hydrolysing)